MIVVFVYVECTDKIRILHWLLWCILPCLTLQMSPSMPSCHQKACSIWASDWLSLVILFQQDFLTSLRRPPDFKHQEIWMCEWCEKMITEGESMLLIRFPEPTLQCLQSARKLLAWRRVYLVPWLTWWLPTSWVTDLGGESLPHQNQNLDLYLYRRDLFEQTNCAGRSIQWSTPLNELDTCLGPHLEASYLGSRTSTKPFSPKNSRGRETTPSWVAPSPDVPMDANNYCGQSHRLGSVQRGQAKLPTGSQWESFEA